MYKMDNWGELVDAMKIDKVTEIDAEVFDYWLGVLPPCRMPFNAKFADGTEKQCSFGFAEGRETIVAFWVEGGRYFMRPSIYINSGY